MITDERQNEIRGLITELSDHFNIRPPRVDFKRHLSYGWWACYSFWPPTITITEKACNSERWDSVVCHEFAHHLSRHRQIIETDIANARSRLRSIKRQLDAETKMLRSWDFGYRESQAERARQTKRHHQDEKPQRHRHHDELFARCLWRVIDHHFGSVERYQGFEYKGVSQLISTLDALKKLKKTS